MSARTRLDDTDRLLLALLLRDAKRTHRDLAAEVHLAGSSVYERIKRLERDRVILGYKAIVAPTLLAPDGDFIVRVQLSPTHTNTLRKFERDLRACEHLIGAARLAGLGAYQLRLVSNAGLRSIESLLGRHGLIALTFDAAPIVEEIVAYRDPPLLTLHTNASAANAAPLQAPSADT